jgi:hypothetical protein
VPADVLHPAATATGIGTDRHRLMTAHGVLLKRRRGAKGGIHRDTARATLTRRPGRRNMLWSPSNDKAIPSAGRSSLLHSLFPPPAYRPHKALERPKWSNSCASKNSPGPQRPGLFLLFTFPARVDYAAGVTQVNRLIDAKALSGAHGNRPLWG